MSKGHKTCPDCLGTGQYDTQDCDTGEYYDELCWLCGGTGLAEKATIDADYGIDYDPVDTYELEILKHVE